MRGGSLGSQGKRPRLSIGEDRLDGRGGGVHSCGDHIHRARDHGIGDAQDRATLKKHDPSEEQSAYEPGEDFGHGHGQ
jgi:hypothetical protein